MSAAFAAFLALSAVSPIAAAYEDNDVDYQFHILKQQQNSRKTGRYCGTADVNNAWKVWMLSLIHIFRIIPAMTMR